MEGRRQGIFLVPLHSCPCLLCSKWGSGVPSYIGSNGGRKEGRKESCGDLQLSTFGFESHFFFRSAVTWGRKLKHSMFQFFYQVVITCRRTWQRAGKMRYHTTCKSSGREGDTQRSSYMLAAFPPPLLNTSCSNLRANANHGKVLLLLFKATENVLVEERNNKEKKEKDKF